LRESRGHEGRDYRQLAAPCSRPGWQLTVTSRSSGCMVDATASSLTVDATGDASWTSYGLPPRPLHLSPGQLAALHAAAAFSCEPPIPDERSSSARFVDLHWGGTKAPARRVLASPAQRQLDAFVDDAVLQYRLRRLAERADFRATVTLEPHTIYRMRHPMTVTFDARGTLTIRIARRTITAPTLDLAARVDAIDWFELGGPSALRMPPGLADAIDRATYDAGMQND
jgi:hypothetical protein